LNWLLEPISGIVQTYKFNLLLNLSGTSNESFEVKPVNKNIFLELGGKTKPQPIKNFVKSNQKPSKTYRSCPWFCLLNLDILSFP